MSLKHAILGFLAFKPMTGYDLKKACDHSIRHFWPANQSQIYRTLGELKEEGWVTQEVIERDERLDMKVYHISETGQAELQRWLTTPLPPQDYREAFLIQVYFAGKLANDEVIALLRHEAQNLQEILALYGGIFQANQAKFETHPDPRALFLSLLTLEYGMLSSQAALDWVTGAIQRLETGDYTFPEMGQSSGPTGVTGEA